MNYMVKMFVSVVLQSCLKMTLVQLCDVPSTSIKMARMISNLGMGGGINARVGTYKMSPAAYTSQRAGVVDTITHSDELLISLKCY
jgi:hypothetical protein